MTNIWHVIRISSSSENKNKSEKKTIFWHFLLDFEYFVNIKKINLPEKNHKKEKINNGWYSTHQYIYYTYILSLKICLSQYKILHSFKIYRIRV